MNNKTFPTVITVFAISACVLAINGWDKEAHDVGEVYTASYSFCEKTTYGPKGISHCEKWGAATETRIARVTEGRFFDLHSYRVVK